MSEFVLPTLGGLYLRDAIEGTITDADEGKREVLVSFPHDKVDTYKTTFGTDAFRESFALRKPLMCWQHDMRDPIGHAISAQVTPRANELVGKFSDFDAVPNAKRAYSQIDDGTITDFSFGFRHPKFEKHKRFPGVRNIARAQMMEFSPVSIGSIPGAVVTGLREEDLMAEHSVEEIRGLVDSQIITPEQGAEMLARLDSDYREIIRIAGGVQHEVVPAAAGGGGEDDEATVYVRGEVLDPGVPEEGLSAQHIVDVLPDSWRAALDGSSLHVVPEGMEISVRDAGVGDSLESGIAVAEALDAACTQAAEFLGEVDTSTLPEGVRDALELYGAAGTSASALLEILGVRAPKSPSSEPGDPAGSENMEAHEVSCDMCSGTGAVENGAICPQCDGSGVEAVVRAWADAPDDAKKCKTCKGKGTMRGGSMDCKNCDGKGWVGADADDGGTRTDADGDDDGDIPCPKCTDKGEKPGHLANGDACPECKGKGYLPVVKGDNGPNKRDAEDMDYRFVSAADRKAMAKKGVAMDNGDFPIPDKGHLTSALGHWSSYTGDKDAAKTHIKKRAKALDVTLDDDAFGGGTRTDESETVDADAAEAAAAAARLDERLAARKPAA